MMLVSSSLPTAGVPYAGQDNNLTNNDNNNKHYNKAAHQLASVTVCRTSQFHIDLKRHIYFLSEVDYS